MFLSTGHDATFETCFKALGAAQSSPLRTLLSVSAVFDRNRALARLPVPRNVLRDLQKDE